MFFCVVCVVPHVVGFFFLFVLYPECGVLFMFCLVLWGCGLVSSHALFGFCWSMFVFWPYLVGLVVFC